MFVTEVTTTNSINVKTEVKVGNSGKTATELESSVGTMLTTSSGTSPLREALIVADPVMEYKYVPPLMQCRALAGRTAPTHVLTVTAVLSLQDFLH